MIVYRDGVGEGQIEQVKDVEVKTIHEVFKEMKMHAIQLTYIIVTKRINSRFVIQKTYMYVTYLNPVFQVLHGQRTAQEPAKRNCGR